MLLLLSPSQPLRTDSTSMPACLPSRNTKVPCDKADEQELRRLPTYGTIAALDVDA